MHMTAINQNSAHPADMAGAELISAALLAAAARGDAAACFELGVACSTLGNGAEYDLIEAHKWFNLAAARGHEEAAYCRAELADEMTAREIAEAQRRARMWLVGDRARAA